MKEMKDYFEILTDKQKKIFEEIFFHLVNLGYKPKKEKKKSVSYNFVHKTIKNGIFKFSSERGVPFLKMKFFASKEYSAYFSETLQKTIEEFDFKYTGCYGCGRCKGSPQGYTVKYDDGRTFFRCGYEFIELKDPDPRVLNEIISLLTIQHEYYINLLAAQADSL